MQDGVHIPVEDAQTSRIIANEEHEVSNIDFASIAFNSNKSHHLVSLWLVSIQK
jgi:hypothetical protein